MRQNKTSILRFLFLPLFLFLVQSAFPPALQAQDKIPREYTNPDEVVTFDRNTSFQRALDVINEFAQENLNKTIIDRTNTEGTVGVSIPPMHWQDALDMMLSVKDLVLLEQADFFEIVTDQTRAQQAEGGPAGAAQAAQQQTEDGEVVATIHSREVRINAIFFEGSRRALREIGVDWSTLTEDVPAGVNSFIGGQQGGGGGSGQLPATSGFEDQFVSVNSKGAQNVSQNVFNALINFGQIGTSGIEVQALFSAFEADNLGEILASPSVKVMDGEEGRIQVGQDFSIKQRDFAGNVTDQFFSVGTILTVTPTIIEQNDTTIIHADIQAERSSAQPDPVSTIVNKQTAETQAILVDGEATAIAGLYRSEVSEVRRGVPVLKDLPPWVFGLRYLFGYNSRDQQLRELVILVQAEIEPTIAERYNKKQPSKFDVLNEERQRIRDEISEKDEGSNLRMEMMGSESDYGTEEPEAQEPEEEQSQPEDETVIPDQDTTENQGNEEQEDYIDPEVQTEPVPLNLGGEEPEEDFESAEENNETQISDQSAINEQQQTEVSEDEEEMQEQQQQDMPPVPAQNDGDVEDYSYFVIGSSFKSEGNALNFRDKLREEGFNAMIIPDQSTGFHYVAYNGYNTVDEAEAGLSDIRQYYNSDAWLFIKR